jgi:hypothetical protein
MKASGFANYIHGMELSEKAKAESTEVAESTEG